MRHTGEGRVVSLADEGRARSTALRDYPRSEDLWSPTPLSLTFADRSAVPPRPDRERRR
jgi:hypothetical protein